MDVSKDRLIVIALKLIGLNDTSLANCKILSAQILRETGKSISPITLYRIGNPHVKYGRPYSYSLALIQQFIDSSILHRTNSDFIEDSSLKKGVSHKGLFYLAVSALLQDQNAFLSFFNKLPINNSELGWDRVICGIAINDYLKNNFNAIDKSFLSKLIKSKQFGFYYLETVPVFSSDTPYFKLAQKWFLKERNRLAKEIDIDVSDTFLFTNSIRVYTNYIEEDLVELKENGLLLISKKLRNYLTKTRGENYFLHVRYYCAVLIYSKCFESDVQYKKREKELVDKFFPSILKVLNSYEKLFVRGIIADTLLMLNSSRWEKFVSRRFVINEFRHVEPQIERLYMYKTTVGLKRFIPRDFKLEDLPLSVTDYNFFYYLVGILERKYNTN